jgi:hypothetical protein
MLKHRFHLTNILTSFSETIPSTASLIRFLSESSRLDLPPISFRRTVQLSDVRSGQASTILTLKVSIFESIFVDQFR